MCPCPGPGFYRARAFKNGTIPLVVRALKHAAAYKRPKLSQVATKEGPKRGIGLMPILRKREFHAGSALLEMCAYEITRWVLGVAPKTRQVGCCLHLFFLRTVASMGLK